MPESDQLHFSDQPPFDLLQNGSLKRWCLGRENLFRMKSLNTVGAQVARTQTHDSLRRGLRPSYMGHTLYPSATAAW
ncbi:hypothetical protein CHARACLAT_031329 [Characodon lateralis]|uniref:Uncharacterized protein n=1 Tax=Characodon lateralis TaxID=208331 RepID=A0ABU7E6I0_9TELE|nr:hypothetical protein [Characodon lateralis]